MKLVKWMLCGMFLVVTLTGCFLSLTNQDDAAGRIIVPVVPSPRNSVVMVYNDNGHGSGSIISANKVLSAAHVAMGGDLKVRTLDGDVYEVILSELDPDSDLVVLTVSGEFEETPLIVDPTPLKIGNKVCLIGTPVDVALLNTVLPGSVVNVDVQLVITDVIYTNLDMTDVHFAPGCSGGPLIDENGNIRGVCVIGGYGLGGIVPVEELDLCL
jgi:S1-C subfamily serine protease